ncbi:hypothetical protein [Pseudomonas chlororaphis]|uniref:hypothetical protein n=1 Tax=Pseudomonas chlororaphis TaxID=587753 RepID=UPI000A9D9548|nr:hypothetical protein [Pseudomonas chlororaphis]AZD02381.1 hypothetical protein C4K27_3187 [Pseudomonas chlororaphis subsp. chlororaphis]MBM0280435.1 hypothetical protein [Pseudomonas chlororaphis]MDO1504925.1 hypothetical protein [Pseudomonas chlororaphis]TWR96047.1 hypothetical protein FJD36_13925 [Pseudomonas chlororaphis subsp. chlororaphis]WDH00700.1 hypothetical protein PUP54_14310 [Pseudomonas chlororaphis]
MKINGLPRPQIDECLSSWVYRVEHNGSLSIHEEWFLFSKDPDYDVPVALVDLIADKAQFDLSLIQRFFSYQVNWCFPWKNRLAYCLDCFREDIAGGGLPYWRRCWCSLHQPICSTHRKLLSTMPTQSKIGPDKPWSAFSSELNYPPVTALSRNHLNQTQYHSINALMIRSAFRVQNYVNLAHATKNLHLPGLRSPIPSCRFLSLVRFLFSCFLYPRTLAKGLDGIARGFQRGLSRNSYPDGAEARIAGCEDPNTFSRMTALILIGVVIGVIRQEVVQKYSDQLYLHAFVRRCGLVELGQYGVNLLDDTEVEEAVKIFIELPPLLLLRVKPFVEGMKKSESVFVRRAAERIALSIVWQVREN